MSDQLTPAELAQANIEPEQKPQQPQPAVALDTPHPVMPDNLTPKEMYFKQLESIRKRALDDGGIFKGYSMQDYDEIKNAEARFGTRKAQKGAIFNEKGEVVRIEGSGDNITIVDERLHFSNRYFDKTEAIKGKKGMHKTRYLVVDFAILNGISNGNITARQVRTYKFVEENGAYVLSIPKNLPVDTVFEEATESLTPNEARDYFRQIREQGYTIY